MKVRHIKKRGAFARLLNAFVRRVAADERHTCRMIELDRKPWWPEDEHA
jgi:hypothetical protein